ncbi:MFS transporter [Microbacterium gorillae]|uniref:MFS transporter n=1 Tax=Microbacterium gorillae TaxID=1231063 RepID=UPI00058EDC0A|nr:MFS transporter [Microbacterium gorillae]
MSNGAPPTTRLRPSTIARYAAGSLGTGGFATLPGLVLTYYLTDNLGVAALFAGVVITVAKLWDVVIDPVIGALTDRQLRRTGTRRGYMLLGALTLPFLFAATFAVPPALGPVVGGIWVLIAFTATATAFSLFQVPYIALPAELTSRYDERTRLLTWRVIVLTAAILLFGGGGPELRSLTGDPVSGYLLMGAVAGVVIAVGMLVATTVAHRGERSVEAPTADRLDIRAHYAAGLHALRRSSPFRALLSTYVLQALATGLMLAGAQYVAKYVMRSEDAVTLLFLALIAPALLAAPVWNLVSRRLGKTRSFRLASLLFVVATLAITVAIWAPGAWLYVPVGLAGVAYAGMQALPMAMLPDVISHDEARHGDNHAGAFSGVWTAGETVGFALSASALTLVLAVTGYVSSTAGGESVQPAAAIDGIVVTFSIVPAVLTVLSLVTLARYRLTRADTDTEPAIDTDANADTEPTIDPAP